MLFLMGGEGCKPGDPETPNIEPAFAKASADETRNLEPETPKMN